MSAVELLEKGDVDTAPIAVISDASSTAPRFDEAESIIDDGRDDDDVAYKLLNWAGLYTCRRANS